MVVLVQTYPALPRPALFANHRENARWLITLAGSQLIARDGRLSRLIPSRVASRIRCHAAGLDFPDYRGLE